LSELSSQVLALAKVAETMIKSVAELAAVNR
jgi:hypothetical protein